MDFAEDSADAQAGRQLPSRDGVDLATSAGERTGRQPKSVVRGRFAIPMEEDEPVPETSSNVRSGGRFKIPMDDETPSGRFKIPMEDETPSGRFHIPMEDETPLPLPAPTRTAKNKRSARATSELGSGAHHPFRFKIPMDDNDERQGHTRQENSEPQRRAGTMARGRIAIPMDEAEAETSGLLAAHSGSTAVPDNVHKPPAALPVSGNSESGAQDGMANARESIPRKRSPPAATPRVQMPPRPSPRLPVEPPTTQRSARPKGMTTTGASQLPGGGQPAGDVGMPELSMKQAQSSSSTISDLPRVPDDGHDRTLMEQPEKITYAPPDTRENGPALTAATATRVLELTAERGIILARLEALGALQNANVNNMEAVDWIPRRPGVFAGYTDVQILTSPAGFEGRSACAGRLIYQLTEHFDFAGFDHIPGSYDSRYAFAGRTVWSVGQRLRNAEPPSLAGSREIHVSGVRRVTRLLLIVNATAQVYQLTEHFDFAGFDHIPGSYDSRYAFAGRTVWSVGQRLRHAEPPSLAGSRAIHVYATTTIHIVRLHPHGLYTAALFLQWTI
ncbi:uncharacterized protein B0H18DRAFT_958976 [Fomitopsis serialis]|uniref:uncharacterized protein n=1 Tax=Fomitopsis serialis TaxID=139415 RepID=UPI00200890F3|nr:uncharacterized protein B0H18DRAFT_958976 [Neoantrodia serialis]KAH9916144.1 hypothetical protein B0H18DRAFT_958976 [Neoantrodia serialis]